MRPGRTASPISPTREGGRGCEPRWGAFCGELFPLVDCGDGVSTPSIPGRRVALLEPEKEPLLFTSVCLSFIDWALFLNDLVNRLPPVSGLSVACLLRTFPM